MRHPRYRDEVEVDNPDVIDRRGEPPPARAHGSYDERGVWQSASVVYRADMNRAVATVAAIGVGFSFLAFLFGRDYERANPRRERSSSLPRLADPAPAPLALGAPRMPRVSRRR